MIYHSVQVITDTTLSFVQQELVITGDRVLAMSKLLLEVHEEVAAKQLMTSYT